MLPGAVFDQQQYSSTHRPKRADDDTERKSSGSARLPARWLTPPSQHADVTDLTDANYADQVTGETVPVLIDFWAETCVPCRMQEPIIEQLAEEMRGQLKVTRCNVLENPKLLESFRVRGVPHLTVLRHGEVVLELIGDHSLPQLRAHLRDAGIE